MRGDYTSVTAIAGRDVLRPTRQILAYSSQGISNQMPEYIPHIPTDIQDLVFIGNYRFALLDYERSVFDWYVNYVSTEPHGTYPHPEATIITD